MNGLKRKKSILGMTSEGGAIMAQTAKRGWQPGRALTLVAGLVLAGGVLIATAPAQVTKDKPTTTIPAKDKDKPKPGDKAPPEKTHPEKPFGLGKKVITLPKDATSDVVETVDIINKKL